VLEVVHSNIQIPEIIRETVPGRRSSDSKSPEAVRAETVTRYYQKMSTGWTEVLPWRHIGDRYTVIDQILWSSTMLGFEQTTVWDDEQLVIKECCWQSSRLTYPIIMCPMQAPGL